MPTKTEWQWWQKTIAPALDDRSAERVELLRRAIRGAPSLRIGLSARMVLAQGLFFGFNKKREAIRELRRVILMGGELLALRASVTIVMICSLADDVTGAAREARTMATRFPHRAAPIGSLSLAKSIARKAHRLALFRSLDRAWNAAIVKLERSGRAGELATIRMERSERLECLGKTAEALRLLKTELRVAMRAKKDQADLELINSRISRLRDAQSSGQ